MSGTVSMQVSGNVAWVTLIHAGKFNLSPVLLVILCCFLLVRGT